MDKNTVYVEDSRILDAMDCRRFEIILDWLRHQVTSGRKARDIVDLLRGQIELGLYNEDTQSLRSIERIAKDFFVDDIIFSKSPFIFRPPISRTTFGLLRQEWFAFAGMEES